MPTEWLAIQGGMPVRTRPFGPTHDFGNDVIAALLLSQLTQVDVYIDGEEPPVYNPGDLDLSE